jgi:hypothetical protein
MATARVFLLAGQSNMVGAGLTGDLPPDLRAAPPNVRLFEDGQERDLVWGETFGPEVGFAHTLAPHLDPDPLVLCKTARGGANLFYDWNPDGVSRGPEDEYRGPMYPALIEHLQQVASALQDSDGDSRLEAMLWMQGERDSVFPFMAGAYEENLLGFIAAVRRDTGAANLPFILGRVAPRVYLLQERRFQHAWREVVQDAQQRVAEDEDGVALVETRDLPQSDNLHFDARGQLELGRRFARAYGELVGS